MTRRMQAAALCLLALCLLAGQAAAAELPEGLARAAPEAAALVSGNGEEGFGLLSGVQALVEEGLADMGRYLASGVRAIAAIMAGVVLLGALESILPAGGNWQYGTAAGALWITAMAAGDLTALIGLGRETIVEVSVRQVAAVFFADILLTVIERVLLPMVYLYIGTAAAGAVLEGDVMERIGELLKKVTGWILSGLLLLFTTYLTLSGAVAGAADAQAVKLAKSAVSAAVPVVGGILSETAESVLAGAGVMKGMVGAMGTLAVLGACLLPFLRLGCQYLLYQGASLVAATVGPKKLTRLIAALGDAFGLVLAMTAASALLLVISLVSSLTAVAP